MTLHTIASWTLALFAVAPAQPASAAPPHQANLVFCCAADNDLYRVLGSDETECPRHNKAIEAVRAAPVGAGVLILADEYPERTTPVEPGVFEEAAKKRLRLYVEYPTQLPDMKVGQPQGTDFERGVVTSDVFGEALRPMRILMIHDCHFVPVETAKPHLVVAKVAGFDTAVFGLEDTKAQPILFEHPRGDVLVATTKLSQFVTARYAPRDAWQAVWKMVFEWLQPGAGIGLLHWTPTVHPRYTPDATLPSDADTKAIIRGINWHSRAGLLPAAGQTPLCDLNGQPVGDGQRGMFECFLSSIRRDGSQPLGCGLRTDCIGESSLAFALRAEIDGDQRSRRIAANLLDWVYFESKLVKTDPKDPAYGLIGWVHRDNIPYYGDNDVKAILGTIGTAAILDSDRWDESLVRAILANFRTTGPLGFRGNVLNGSGLKENGWQYYWRRMIINPAAHYEVWIWATYLWLYDKTGYRPLLERTESALRMMMQMYPDQWRWTNGIQQERGRMLLTLAWLVRVDDTREHRAWLKRIADDMLEDQVACGAFREELGDVKMGSLPPPQSNARYGTGEASIIQNNGDPVADMLYTNNFTFLGLHEAAAATGNPQYRQMEDKLADFLLRIQIESDFRPELDGGWFRAFDFNRWEYWAANADVRWGAWSIEAGWTQGWIITVLAMRHLQMNLWDVSENSQAGKWMQKYRKQMLPDDQIPLPSSHTIRHDAVGRPVRGIPDIDRRYPGMGAWGLTNGIVNDAEYLRSWLGFEGLDFTATIDLGQTTPIHTLASSYLQQVKMGIFLPRQVKYEASDDGLTFRTVATIKPNVSQREEGPLVHTLKADSLDVQARYVRVSATNVGAIPAWHPAGRRGIKTWLFVDEIMVNPVAAKAE